MNITVSATDFNKDEQVSKTSINYKENKVSKDGKATDALGAAYISGNDNASIGKDNTYASLLKEADDVKQQIMESASSAKLSLKALAKKLSGAGAVKLDEDGFNLTDATKEECVDIIDKIRIELAMHSDDYVSYGTGVSKEAIESVAGSEGMVNAIEAKMNNVGILADEDSVAEVEDAVNKASELKPLTEDSKNYMIANNIQPTIEGIYQAENVTSYGVAGKSQPISDAEFDSLKPQIIKVIQAAGMEAKENVLENARNFIDNNIPVTKENLLYENELDNINLENMDSEEKKLQVMDKIIDNMVIGNEPKDTLLVEGDSIISRVKDALNVMDKVTYDDVAQVVNSGNTFTLKNLSLCIEGRMKMNASAVTTVHHAAGSQTTAARTAAAQTSDNQAAGSQTIDRSYTALIKTRILMTASAGVFLEKNNISIMTTSIEELSAELKQLELQNMAYEGSEENLENVLDVKTALYEIKESPIEVFGEVLTKNVGDIISLSVFAGRGSDLKKQYDRAARTYEAVGTEVRKDLGDSINKATQNSTDSIIRELGLEGTALDRDAVRILARNNMEMTNDNISKIKEVYSTLNNLISNMKPETVLDMIKDGINPMQDSIEDVNNYLVEKNMAASRDNEEKFSKFLYKLDITNGITPENREQFIGIYQMMNIFTKDAGVAAGALVKQGSDVTMGNLMSAYSSVKHSGIDMSIDDNTGFAEVSGKVNYYTSLFSMNKKFVTPNTLKNVEGNGDINNTSVENFTEQLRANYDDDIEMAQDEEYNRMLSMAAESNDEITREIKRAGIQENIGNIQAVKILMESGVFPKISGNTDEKISDKYNTFDDVIEKIGHREELESMYEEFATALDDELEEAVENSLTDENGNSVTVDYNSLNDLRISNRQIGYIKNLAMRHDYMIPYVLDNKVGIINLTLVSDSEDKGRISVHLKSALLGEISVEAKVSDSQAGIFVMINGENEERNNSLDERLSQLESDIKNEFDISEVSIHKSRTDRVPYIKYDDADKSVPAEKLYGIASKIVKALG
ncbi:MAG: DUF6240 domain-containing protein [Eubacteriales bacterium]|nr:DUF6240 domain-containing protein [Eubacteriales bacterium]